MKLLLATTSRGKLREQKEALAVLDLELSSLDEWPELPVPEEPHATFRENAIAKALYYHRATGLPALAEDAGLVVDALGGKPGVESARWLGHDTPYSEKNARLLQLLAGTPPEGRTARYVSAVALAGSGKVLFEHEASCEGVVAAEPAGEGGFGYDPIFFYPPFGKTFAEISPGRKRTVSHRGLAMAELVRYLAASHGR